MKKFSFSLQSVLGYKNSILDNLMNEHSIILQKVYRQQDIIKALQLKYREVCIKFDEEKAVNIKVEKLVYFEKYLDLIDREIDMENEKLKLLKKQEENKRKEVINAKQEAEAIQKLKEKRIEEYRKDVQKEQELIIEEFISNRRTSDT